MKDFIFLEYSKGPGILHKLGATSKLAGLILTCIIIASSPPVIMLFPSILVVILLFNSGKIVILQCFSMWKLFIFFVISGIVRAFSLGAPINGALFTLRLILMAIAGTLFYSSTRLSRLRMSLERIFGVIPVINGRHIAELTVMALAFLPVIFKTMNEQQQARYSRGFNPRKNIFRTIKLTSIPLMIEMFLKTDEMADAWYSRGWISQNK